MLDALFFVQANEGFEFGVVFKDEFKFDNGCMVVRYDNFREVMGTECQAEGWEVIKQLLQILLRLEEDKCYFFFDQQLG